MSREIDEGPVSIYNLVVGRVFGNNGLARTMLGYDGRARLEGCVGIKEGYCVLSEILNDILPLANTDDEKSISDIIGKIRKKSV